MEVAAAMVALIAVLAFTEGSGEHVASERQASPDVDQPVAPIDEAFFHACDNTTVIYRDLTRPHIPVQGATDPVASEGSE
jgi:hypothetical protein